MKIDNRVMLLLALAAGAAVGTAIATTRRRGNLRTANALEHKQDLKAWENEGGNLAPAAPVLP